MGRPSGKATWTRLQRRECAGSSTRTHRALTRFRGESLSRGASASEGRRRAARPYAPLETLLTHISEWTPSHIKLACGRTHGRYKRGLERHYTDYFVRHPELAGSHRFKAKDVPAALPPGREYLAELLTGKRWHPHHLSGGSSQVLAVALLGSAIEEDRSLQWLAELVGVGESGFASNAPMFEFEFEVDRSLLNEYPRVTNLDVLVIDERLVVGVEAKLWEKGFGTCGCDKEERKVSRATMETPLSSAQDRAACSPRILDRPAYWSTASAVLGLPERVAGRLCPIAPSYQAVRNFAAVQALANGRRAVFALFFDDRNPYFRECDAWPGWPALLSSSVSSTASVSFRSCSWQRLLESGAVPPDVVEWACSKHALHLAGEAA